VIAVIDSSRSSLGAVLLGSSIARRSGARLVVTCFLRPPASPYGCLSCIIPAFPAGFATAVKAREVRLQVEALLELEPPRSWEFRCSTGSARAALRAWCDSRSALAIVARGPRGLWRREDLRALVMQGRLMRLRLRPTVVLA
jgi:hypothetical protein